MFRTKERVQRQFDPQTNDNYTHLKYSTITPGVFFEIRILFSFLIIDMEAGLLVQLEFILHTKTRNWSNDGITTVMNEQTFIKL